MLFYLAALHLGACTQGVDSLIPAHDLHMLRSEAHLGDGAELLRPAPPSPAPQPYAAPRPPEHAMPVHATRDEGGISVEEMLRRTRAYGQHTQEGHK